MKTERFEALIDAILAIIITVTVLEIPMVGSGTWEALWGVHLELEIYALSFIVIFNFWNYNNNLFSIINRINNKAIWLIGLELFLLSFLPYLTTFVAQNFNSFIAHASYGLDFLMIRIISVLTGETIKNHDKMNIALQMALDSHKPLYYTIVLMAIGFIIGYFYYPPAITIFCLISIPALWITSKYELFK